MGHAATDDGPLAADAGRETKSAALGSASLDAGAENAGGALAFGFMVAAATIGWRSRNPRLGLASVALYRSAL